MWVFTEIGFFSCVALEDEPTVVMVRGRVKKDLERFQRLVADLGHKPPEISEWSLRDYKYRCLVERDVWAEALGHLAREIRYSNFKARIAGVQGPEREMIYSKVWLITRALTEVEDDR